jgi:NAD(P)-dependent dehydrogenase (short-subunit alcohol dehydrogenase family)
MDRLKGKSIIVTGGSDGIGAAAVKLFANEGAKVLFSGRNKDKGEQCEVEISAAIDSPDGECRFMQADAAEYEDNVQLVDKALELFGRIDCVLCNAGLSWYQPFHELSREGLDEVVKININGTLYMSRIVIPHMVKQQGGSVIFLGSGLASVPQYGLGHYIMTKGAMDLLARCLSLDYCRDNIRFNVYSPGAVWTKAFESSPKEQVQNLINMLPVRRMLTLEEAVAGLVYLASDESKSVYGTTIHADLADSCGRR